MKFKRAWAGLLGLILSQALHATETSWAEQARHDLDTAYQTILAAHAGLIDRENPGFRKAVESGHREAQLADDKHCKGVGLCEVCDKYEKLVAIVDSALGVRPWQLSPIDVVDSPPPPMWSARPAI